MPTPSPTTGILLVGHGTRDKDGQGEFRALFAKVVASLEGYKVVAGHLELVEPTIHAAFETLVEHGVERVIVIPVLLFSAGHAKRDMPAAVHAAAARHPHVRVETRPPFGLDDNILSLSRLRMREALAGRNTLPADHTYWLLVGRGSSDPAAIADLNAFAAERALRESFVRFGVCLVAAARPTLAEGLATAAMAEVKRIIVQPHLLFRGAVLDEIVAAVADWRVRKPGIEWVTTAHLGPAQEVANAIVNRISENR
jgi:sirohydrochlorin ferrochelatase